VGDILESGNHILSELKLKDENISARSGLGPCEGPWGRKTLVPLGTVSITSRREAGEVGQ
jgi:hypothetical protein